MTQLTQMEPGPPSAETPAEDAQLQAREAMMMCDAPEAKPSRWPLIVIAAAGGLMAVGLAIRGMGPSEAEAGGRDDPPPNYAAMTVPQLMDDAGVPAARELARRMHTGTPAEQAAIGQAMTSMSNPRLTRNMAMAMALEAQRRQQEMMVNMERHVREAEEGW